MRRPQFSLKTLLWLMAVVAALFGGREWGIRHERQNRLDDLIIEQERLLAEAQQHLTVYRNLHAKWRERLEKAVRRDTPTSTVTRGEMLGNPSPSSDDGKIAPPRFSGRRPRSSDQKTRPLPQRTGINPLPNP